MNHYTQTKYKDEIDLTLSCRHSDYGSCVIPCPWCGVYGFYAPKNVPNKIARACKWCGVWQKETGKPYRCLILYCNDCIVWNVTENNLNKPCDKCGGKMVLTPWPIDWSGEEYSVAHEARREIAEIHQYPLYGWKLNKTLIDLMTQCTNSV